MTHEELLRKAYLGETIPGFIHNMGNPLGALLGFMALITEEAQKLRTASEKLPDGPEKKRIVDSCMLLTEYLTFTGQSETTLREIFEQFVLKCNRDASNDVVEISLPVLVKLEAAVMETNRFYKHKIKKQFSYGEDIPHVEGLWRHVSQPVSSIMSSYTHALQTVTDPTLTVNVRTGTDGKPEIEILANTHLPATDVPNDTNFSPVLSIDACTTMLRPLARLTYIVQGQSSSVRITFT